MAGVFCSYKLWFLSHCNLSLNTRSSFFYFQSQLWNNLKLMWRTLEENKVLIHVSLVYGKNSIPSTKFQLHEAWTIGNMGFDLSWITYIEEVSRPFWSILQLYLSGNTTLIQNTVNMHSLMHLSMLSCRGGRPGIGGGFELRSFFLFKCPTPGTLSLVKRVQIPHPPPLPEKGQGIGQTRIKIGIYRNALCT